MNIKHNAKKQMMNMKKKANIYLDFFFFERRALTLHIIANNCKQKAQNLKKKLL